MTDDYYLCVYIVVQIPRCVCFDLPCRTVQLLYNYQTLPALDWDNLQQTGKNGIVVHLPKGYFNA